MVAAAVVLPTHAFAVPFGYVPNHGDGTVSVIDTANSAIVSTVTVGDQPLAAAVNAVGTRAYVTNQLAPTGTVSVIDTVSNSVVGTITVGGRPSGVAVKPPGDRVYVTNRDDKSVSVIDAATNTVVATVPVGNNPLGVAVDPSGSPAYVANRGTNDVSVIDTATNAVVGTIQVGPNPGHIAISPNGFRVYVTNSIDASVSVIDAYSRTVVGTIQVGTSPEGVAVDPTGARAYVANSGPDNVSVIDTALNKVVATVNVGNVPIELALRPDGARLFVTNRQGASVSVIDTATNVVKSTIVVGGAPQGYGQFIVPSLPVPRFTSTAQKCQVEIAHQASLLAKTHHLLEVTCRLGIIKAEASGKGTAKAEAACQKALDLADPASKLSVTRFKVGSAILKKCFKVTPRDVNGPCSRGAGAFSATADCLIAHHGTRVAEIVGAEFSATRPVPLTKPAQDCEAAIVKSSRRFTEVLHKDFGSCLKKLLGTPDGKDEAKVTVACVAALDLANPFSKASVSREAALGRIAKKCETVVPADLGSPCDTLAPTVSSTASCVLAGDAARVAEMLAAEFNDVCSMLTRIGLAGSYPAVCAGSP